MLLTGKTQSVIKKALFVSIALFPFISFVSCKKDSSSNKITLVNTDTAKATVKPVYALVWSDEFDGTAVDTSKWRFDLGNLHVNNEKEYYQTQNATVNNGNLMITARKETVAG